jgi:hypothetical protein
MAQHDRLITFLEREAAVLRERITYLREHEDSIIEVTGQHERTPSPLDLSRKEAEEKLVEVEEHLRELKDATAD